MELDAPAESQQLDGVVPSLTSQPGSGKEGGKDLERFYCPYPGCNRSFAELWRLKVHFRAPPDIRGSGKERGHGTELTHCPKCGKTLKPGKHHVGCSGSKTNARQANKRSRPGGEVEPTDDALATSPPAKHVKGGELDVEQPLASSWQDYARSQGAHALQQITLQPHLKQEQQEWPPAIQPGILYGSNGTATACWLPGQVNGFVPQGFQAQGYSQPQYHAELQYAGSSHGYPQQVPSFPSLSGYSAPGLPALSEPGQVLSLAPGGALPQLSAIPGVPQGAVSAVNTVLFTQQPHDTSLVPSVNLDHHGQQQQQQVADAHTLLPSSQAQGQSQQQQPPNDSSCNGGQLQSQQQQLPGRIGSAPGQGDGGSSGAGRGDTVDGGAGGGGGGGTAQPAKATASNDSLGSVFGDVEEFTRDFGRIPSPPPLPPDFHSASSGGNGVLFNFAQFGQKLPRSQSHTRLDRNLSAVGLAMDNGLDTDVLYDHSEDGDLMQLLFGVPDELPTMATIHLHKWGNEEEEEEQLGSNGGRPVAGLGPGSAALGQHALDRSSSQTAAATPQPEASQPQPPGDHMPAPGVVAGGGVNGKMESLEGPDVHSHGNGPESYLAPGVPSSGGGGGGKAVLSQQVALGVNGMSTQSHVGDEHHRDHLLDAETFRLLQSCD